MLKQRIITAVILLIILAGSIYLSPLAFAAVMTFSVAAAIWEWLRMLQVKAALPVAAVIGAGMYGAWFAGLRLPYEAFLAVLVADVILWAVITAGLFRDRGKGYRLPRGVQIAMALLMLPAAWYSLMWIFEIGSWPLVVTVLVLVWTADVFAYFSGRLFGRHKMAPAISPKKTWEGAAGAFVFGFIVLFALGYGLPRSDIFQADMLRAFGAPVSMALTVVLTILSMAGDLLESAAKRQAGIKDSSNLLPGHGGFFDRLDACVPVMPAAALVLLIVESTPMPL